MFLALYIYQRNARIMACSSSRGHKPQRRHSYEKRPYERSSLSVAPLAVAPEVTEAGAAAVVEDAAPAFDSSLASAT